MVSACRQRQFVHGLFEEGFALAVEFAVLLEMTGAHVGVAGDLRALEAFGLDAARGDDALADGCRRLALDAGAQLAIRDGRDLDVQVGAVQQRSGDPREVIPHLSRGAGALLLRVAEEPARTPVWSDY